MSRGGLPVALEAAKILLLAAGKHFAKKGTAEEDRLKALPPANIVVVKDEKEREKVIINADMG